MSADAKTDVLIVGRGAREHALAWKVSQSPRVGTIYVAPGNAGTETFCTNVDIVENNIADLAKFASTKRIGLTIVGPDEPLSLGIVDQFKRNGLRIFGPTKAAAQIESSKSFAKKIMEEAHIPMVVYRAFADTTQALEYVRASKLPIVVKADGLAAGKGVYICDTVASAETAIDEIMVKKVLGEAGSCVVIEEFLSGNEISIHAMTDGVNYYLFPSSQDYKRIGEGDTGKNTGGMGAIAPVPWVTAEMMLQIENTVIKPLIQILGIKGMPFQGMLFPGIMITAQGPKVIELNARFGDPECQVYMRILENDLLDLIDQCVDGGVGTTPPRFSTVGAVNVVLTSSGYPDAYRTGYMIEGIKEAEQVENIVLFHAGTLQRDILQTNGGRVISVTATGSPIEKARELAYKGVEKIRFEGKYFRPDIGNKSMQISKRVWQNTL
jgi:phosphoribosylamine--glycine ligase